MDREELEHIWAGIVSHYPWFENFRLPEQEEDLINDLREFSQDAKFLRAIGKKYLTDAEILEIVNFLKARAGKARIGSFPGDVVNELVSKPQYLHFGFGSLGREASRIYGSDWRYFPIKGDLSLHPDLFGGYLNRLKSYKKLEREFEALKNKWYISRSTKDKKQRELWHASPSKEIEIRKILNKMIKQDPVTMTFRDWVQGDWKQQSVSDVKSSLAKANDRYDSFPKFLARVFGERIGNSYVFSIYYKSHDGGGNITYISYGLAILLSERAVILQIAGNPNLLIEVFRKAYPGLDESGGSLRIMQGEVHFKDIPK